MPLRWNKNFDAAVNSELRIRGQQRAATLKKGAVMNKAVAVKSLITIAFLLAFLMVLPTARANQSDQATKVTFNQPIQIPGRVLPAGTYWFVIAQDVPQPYGVRISNYDRTIVYATVFTIHAERSQPTGRAAFTFAQSGPGQPQAIVTWFYPGETTGHEFVYPKPVREELAKNKQVTVVPGD
jgi:hypothetical protein